MSFTVYPIAPVKRINQGWTTGTRTLVAAVTGKKILVLAMYVHCQLAADATLIIQDDTGTPIELFGAAAAKIRLSKDSAIGPPAITLPFSRRGWFETPSGKALNALIAGTTPLLTFCIVYTEV